jgi:tRNA-specific 2-thiouridylase
MKLAIGESQTYSVRTRYRQPLQSATLHQFERDVYFFEEPQSAITEGNLLLGILVRN